MPEVKADFLKGDYVVYKKQGIFYIADIRKEKICSQKKSYYLLQSVYDKNASIYVPFDSEQLVGMMERILTKEEIEQIIEKSKKERLELDSDSSKRQELFTEILESKELSKVICLMKLLIYRKDQALVNKMKVPAIEERALVNCKSIISEAFAFPLGIDKKDVQEYILSK